MRNQLTPILAVLSATAAFAETHDFDLDKQGTLPAGCSCGVTARGSRK